MGREIDKATLTFILTNILGQRLTDGRYQYASGGFHIGSVRLIAQPVKVFDLVLLVYEVHGGLQ